MTVWMSRCFMPHICPPVTPPDPHSPSGLGSGIHAVILGRAFLHLTRSARPHFAALFGGRRRQESAQTCGSSRVDRATGDWARRLRHGCAATSRLHGASEISTLFLRAPFFSLLELVYYCDYRLLLEINTFNCVIENSLTICCVHFYSNWRKKLTISRPRYSW